MAALDNEMFQTLVKQLKVMNRNLEAATAAINGLTIHLTTDNSAPESIPSVCITAKSGNGAGDQAIQAMGYINWVDETHGKLQQQTLVKMTIIRSALDTLKADLGNVNRRAISNSAAGSLSFSNSLKNVCVMDRETRFPLDAVYVDVNDPEIKKEIDFFNKLNTLPTDGVVDRFVAIIEKHMHTPL